MNKQNTVSSHNGKPVNNHIHATMWLRLKIIMLSYESIENACCGQKV